MTCHCNDLATGTRDGPAETDGVPVWLVRAGVGMMGRRVEEDM
jgi:hypothetical protein